MFKDKNIALVLSCKREYYKKRLLDNKETLNMLHELEFLVVLLYADPSINEPKLEIYNDIISLTVPCPDIYELLSVKMEMAFKYFQEKEVNGILKIDDNTTILNKESFSKIIPYLNSYDYFGIQSPTFSPSIKSENNYYLNHFDKEKYTYNCFKNIFLRLQHLNMKFMAGPFYWVSLKAIDAIVQNGLEYLYEDVSVGYAISKKPLKSYCEPSFFKTVISWDNSTE